MVEEINEELTDGNTDEVKTITGDLIQNLEKIHYHGERASGIVKSMLAHSRVGNGNKEPTNINALADEYLRLAYHGLRAKDKSFNADFKTDLDENVPDISVIPQDIGRVLLNIFNNAFFACAERSQSTKSSENENFKPLVTVNTRKETNKVEIKISDNGTGIPKPIKNKIFQPFFTTKSTGEGTGLGLSLSYDIITKGHGGELKVVSTAGKGTTFYIILPIIK